MKGRGLEGERERQGRKERCKYRRKKDRREWTSTRCLGKGRMEIGKKGRTKDRNRRDKEEKRK